MTTKEKQIEFIKKLLALSTDPSTTESERVLALQRAQQLMAKYTLTDINVEAIEKEIIRSNYSFGKLPIALRDPMSFVLLINPIANNFGCYVAYSSLDQATVLYGFKTNIEITKFACDTLLTQGLIDYRNEFMNQRSLSFGIAFWTGFREGLHAKFKKEKCDEQALVLYDKVKANFEKNIRYVDKMESITNAQGLQSGFNSAQNAQIRPGINSTTKGNLLK